MSNWHQIVENARSLVDLKEQLQEGRLNKVYPRSVQLVGSLLLFLVKDALTKALVVVGDDLASAGFEGEIFQCGSFSVKEAPLNHHNAGVLRGLLPWTAPQSFGPHCVSLGLGDRLGLASPGHLKALRSTSVRPILAQQSMRELDLTNRTYAEVLDAASWAVFQEGYKDGFGADGDHLKTIPDIQTALNLGFSMITLDCSEHIDDSVRGLQDSEVQEKYAQLPEAMRVQFESLYKGSEQSPEQYYRMVLTYYQAIEFIDEVYHEVIAKLDREIDFEISIDEVATPTTPQDHFFVANELSRRAIRFNSIAPRFCGQFEKGIDYLGDVEQFQQEYAIHVNIARQFGYKLSIHSGSDKFSVFPIIGELSKGGFHVKTAGTNWLEAVRVIAKVNPALYREIHSKALATLDEARRYYQVSLDLTKIPMITDIPDEQLSSLLNQDDARQLLHITYGFILQDSELKDAVFATLIENETLYEESLGTHLKRHLTALGINR